MAISLTPVVTLDMVEQAWARGQIFTTHPPPSQGPVGAFCPQCGIDLFSNPGVYLTVDVETHPGQVGPGLGSNRVHAVTLVCDCGAQMRLSPHDFMAVPSLPEAKGAALLQAGLTL